MLALALALGSSLCWGLADFAGGLQARRVPLAAVMLFSQLAPLGALAVVVAVIGDPAPSFSDLAPAAAAGAAGSIALAGFYHALSIGTMSIVAPISATGAIVPVAVGVATGDRPSSLQVVGIVAAVAGVVLASREQSDDPARAESARRSVILALLAAVGFGSFFVGMDAAASASVPWALLVARGSSVLVLLAVVLALRPPLAVGRRSLAVLAAIGVADLTANALFALASTKGLLSLVAVLGSLYPVTTVLLARFLLRERVRRVQEAGIVFALVGVALIAGG
jgi:drug/metabolite transporter (DMT)-like permease